MARERRRQGADVSHPRNVESKTAHTHKREKKTKVDPTNVCMALAAVCCFVGAISFAYHLYLQWWLARLIITPHGSPRILDANSSSPAVAPERFWGSYRPQVYFGMKTRSPKSLVTGLMWMQQREMDVSLRHTCEQSDRLPSYGWLMHDGVNFGVQEIQDFGFNLRTEFVKRVGGQHGGDWSWRITGINQSSGYKMARERRRQGADVSHPRNVESKTAHTHKREKKTKVDPTNVCMALAAVCCFVGAISFAYHLYLQWWLARLIITPHGSPRILDANSSSPAVAPERFWGSYRPQVYFGMKTRSPKSLVTGLMWMQQREMDVSLRHTCEQSDRLPSYGWLMHDGVNFGVQEIQDFGFNLRTEFVKRVGGQHGGDWSWRITGINQSSGYKMARERRRQGADVSHPRNVESKTAHTHKREKKTKVDPTNVCMALAAVCCFVGAISFAYHLYLQWWLARLIITPHGSPRILDANSSSPAVAPERFWGSYRPQVYFGMKTRSPKSLVTGLMWMQQREMDVSLRHTCEQSDRLPSYGWLMHDGVNFGVQEIQDFGFNLRTEFVKRVGGQHGGDWSWRITGINQNPGAMASLISLLFYVATDGQGSLQPHVEERSRLASVTGSSEELGYFRLNFHKPKGETTSASKYASYNYLKAVSPGLHRLTDVVKSSLNHRFVYSPPTGAKRHYFAVDSYQPPPHPGGAAPLEESHLVVHQVTLQLPFEIEVTFESGSFSDRPNSLVGNALSKELSQYKAAFEEKFARTFRLRDKGFSPSQVVFAQSALSNMIGGMGFFHGHSFVQSKYNEQPVAYPEGPLYTAVPSRSFFPRGFLWDEGFHQLLVSKWDPSISQEVIAHWLDLINIEGWIPREQILDSEARSKVPAEFILQRNENANPPTLFLTLHKLLTGMAGATLTRKDELYLWKLLPRLKTWYDWYNSTQSGPLPYTFRWRGRDEDTNLFLNPKTLTSGLDDYPRASHPSADERHVDLRCWMVLASQVMAQVSQLLGEPAEEYQRMQLALSDNSLLEKHHWSEQLQAFSDYGNHTQAVILEREKIFVPPGHNPHHHPPARLLRVVRKPPRLQYVAALGYVSLFPFLLNVLQPDSPRLETIFKDLRSEKKLWTPYGLRSLSKSSTMYMKYNTEHDGPYWRGPIWININYLAVRALHHYAGINGPFREQANSLYHELRANLIGNVYRQYMETGYFWEQYNDITGRGQGSYPFTGWSALVVLMMAEEY